MSAVEMTDAEALRRNEAIFKRLAPGALFDAWFKGDPRCQRRWFIVRRRIALNTVEVVELDASNRERVIVGTQCTARTLRLEDISSMNLLQ